ncbi:hypothetical protein A3A66_02400 [Microgenomates group bacterium RIFCSPLOWO2_01_FULL_46_13]|nr:MAG: hypothetical protein A2783_00510 [Microgenomates group bacterium RIFCSPHIGHO2_01_FULL_45_11]OGV94824.1 MAG: hypothetical protein A3A66_02400 [Microgenomates group bacterium RIFCSPLOWO2_01_FULL_46_13]
MKEMKPKPNPSLPPQQRKIRGFNPGKLITFPAQVLEPIKHYLLHQEKKLNHRKDSLLKEDPFTNPDRLNDNASIDTDAAEQFGHARSQALRQEIDKTLVRIRKALTRIKLGRYGLCENCGRMIDTDRLAIDPSIQFCLSCQKKLQSKEEE